MAHKQKYYKNIDVNGHLWRLEIWQDTEVELTPKEIGPVLQSLRIAVQGSQADVDTPIVKTSLEMSFIDAPGHEEERKCGYWEEFYTSAATEYLVKLYKDGQIEWSGYVTPDSFEEDLRYRGSVSIIARDNLGYLQDFKFRMHTDDGLVDLNTLVDEAKKVIDFQMDVLGAQLFPTSSNGGDLRQVLFNIAAFRDKTWWEVLESAFYSVGVTMRYVGRNSFILAPIREQSKCGYADYEDMPTRETRFLSYGHRELVPAAKSVIDKCEFDILESLVEIYAPDYQFGGQSSLTFVETSQGLESGSYSMPVYEYASQSAGVASAQAGASRLLNPYNYKLRAGGADAQQKSIHSDDVLYALSNTIRVTSYENEQTGIVTYDYHFQKVNPVVFASRLQQGGVVDMRFTFERPVVLYPDGTIGDFVESQYGERLFLQALGFKATWEGDNGVKRYLYHATLDGGWSDTDNGQVVTIPSGATEFFTNPVTVALPSLNVDGPGELRIEFYGAYFPTTVNRNGESHQGAYIRITAVDIMLAGEGAVHAAKNSKTTTNYNSKNNLLIERSAELAPNPNRPLAPQMIVNNIMVQDTTGVTGAMNWTWGLGYEDMPLSVMIHKQLLCYHAQPMDLLSGELVSDDCTFDSLYTWNGKEYSLLSGSLNVLTGRIEGAVLREFMRYENLWNEIDTRVRTFALPRSQEQTEDYKTSYRYEDKQKGGMASSPDGSGYVTKKYADETYAPIALVSGVSSRLATIETYFSTTEDVDTQINKWNEIVTFLNATEGTTLAGILATYATKESLNGVSSRVKTLEDAGFALAKDVEASVAGINVELAKKATIDALNEGLNDRYTKKNVDDLFSNFKGTENITTLGTITSGVWNGSKIANAYLANSKVTISGVEVSLGGAITQAALRTGLGLDDLIAWYNKVGVAFGKNVDGTYFVDGDFLTNGQFAAAEAGTVGSGSGVMLLTTWPTDSADYSGYALGGNLGVDLNTRVKTLEGKATAVSFSPSLTSGKQIGVLTIDGVAKSLYAPSMYDWSEINAKPTHLSQFTDDVVAGKYLPLSGGTISGQLNVSNINGYTPITSGNILNYAVGYNGHISFENDVNVSGYGYADGGWTASGSAFIVGANKSYRMAFQGFTDNYLTFNYCVDGTWGTWRKIAFTDSNVASADYATGASYATRTACLEEKEILDFTSHVGSSRIEAWYNWGNPTETSFAEYTHGIVATSLDGNVYHYLGFANAQANPRVRSFSYGEDSGWKTIAFVDDNVASATKLQTARSLWGNSFDGTSDVGGNFYHAGTTFITLGDTFTSFGNTARTTYIDGKDIWFNASGVTNMVVTTSGNVGIGTVQPSHLLHVDGTMYGDLKMKTPRNIWGQAFDGTGDVTGSLYYEGARFVSPGVTFTSFGNTSRITYIDGNGIWLNASGNPDMIIDNTGNVIIGATTIAQNGITTNEITIGGIRVYAENGVLKVDGDLYTSGQFASGTAAN